MHKKLFELSLFKELLIFFDNLRVCTKDVIMFFIVGCMCRGPTSVTRIDMCAVDALGWTCKHNDDMQFSAIGKSNFGESFFRHWVHLSFTQTLVSPSNFYHFA